MKLNLVFILILLFVLFYFILNKCNYQEGMVNPFTPSLSLKDSKTIASNIFKSARNLNLNPITIAILDDGGNFILIEKEDGCSVMRPDIAIGKAFGALSLGMNTANMEKLLKGRSDFISSLSSIGAAKGRGYISVPGGVVLLDSKKSVIGAIGVSGDTSENDEKVITEGVRNSNLPIFKSDSDHQAEL